MRVPATTKTVRASIYALMTCNVICVAGELSRVLSTIEADNSEEAWVIAQRLYPETTLAIVCNEDS